MLIFTCVSSDKIGNIQSPPDLVDTWLSVIFSFFFFFGFLGPHSWHMEVFRQGVQSELQLAAYKSRYLVLISFSRKVLSRFMPKSGTAGSYIVVLYLVFWGISVLFSIVVVPIYIPTINVGGCPFFSISSPAFVCWLVNHDHSDRCEVVPLSSFDLHFSNN